MYREHLRILKYQNIPYTQALSLQQSFVDQGLPQGQVNLLCMEHPSVVTLGKHASRDDLLLQEGDYKDRQIDVIQSDRGGLITAHMPGQLVVWPVVQMTPKDAVKEWVSLLEDVVIHTLQEWGIEGHRDSVNPGVWVGHQKICAIGLRIQNRYSTHGLALNVNNDLSVFETIVPCGLRDRGVTTMEKVSSQSVSLLEVQQKIIEKLCLKMKIQSTEKIDINEALGVFAG